MVDVQNIDEITKLNDIRDKVIAAIADVKSKKSQFEGVDSTAPTGFNVGHNLFIRKYASRLTPVIDLSGCYMGSEMMTSLTNALEAKRSSVEARLLVLGVSTEPATVPIDIGGDVHKDISMPRFVRLASGGTEGGTIEYTSSNTNLATVDKPSGVVTMLAEGSLTITATEVGTTNSDSYKLDIHPAFVVGGPVYRYIGTFTMPAVSGGSGTRRYSSSDTEVATINAASGEITSLKVGKCDITVVDTLTDNSKTVELIISANMEPSINTEFLFKDATSQIQFVGGTGQYQYSTNINTVSDTGLITASNVGKMVITIVDTKTQETATLEVEVYDHLFVNDVTIPMGQTASIQTSGGSGNFTFSSDTEVIATVNEEGTVTAVSNGVARITVTDTVTNETAESTITIA